MIKPLMDIDEAMSRSAEYRMDEICDQFEASWKGEQQRPEDYLSRWEGTERMALLQELILIDMDYRRRASETPTPDNCRHHFTPSPSDAETPA